jgi:hypothetical protein
MFVLLGITFGFIPFEVYDTLPSKERKKVIFVVFKCQGVGRPQAIGCLGTQSFLD